MKISLVKVETLMAERAMTKVELAKASGISAQNISTIVRRGTCEPRTAGKLAKGLGVELAEIIKEE